MNRRRGMLVLVGMLALGVGLWAAAGDPEPEPAGPRPSETRAGQKALTPRRAAPVPAEAQVSGDAGPVVLSVAVGSWKAWAYDPDTGRAGEQNAFSASFPPPTTVGWPTADEAPFPDHPVTDAVLAAVAAEEVAIADLVALGEQARTTVDADDIVSRPWDALIALEIARLVSEDDQRRAQAAWNAAEAAPGRGPSPKQARSAELALAEALIAASPDHPVADHARLYQVHALGDVMSDTYDPAAMAAAALDGIRESPDPLVVDQLVWHLSNAGDAVAMSADDLDMLQAIAEDPDARVPRRQLADIGMRSALAAGDADRAAWWTTAHRAELTADCAAEPGIAQICPMLWEAQRAAEAWVAARSDTPPATWQAALIARAHRCGADAELPRPALTGEATWAGAWQWSTWSAPGAVSACIAARVAGPTPSDGQRVTLHVFRGPPGR